MQPTDLDALDAIVGKATKGEWVVDEYGFFGVADPDGGLQILGECDGKQNADAIADLKNAYPALAAELREARKRAEKAVGWKKLAEELENLTSLLREQLQGQKARVEELEAEIEVRDNCANIVFDTLKAALPNRGFHSEMEAAEGAAAELADLRAKLAASEEKQRRLEQVNGDLRKERDRAVADAIAKVNYPEIPDGSGGAR